MTDHDHDQSILKNNLAENSDFESRSQFQKRFIQTSQDSILDRDDLLDELDSLSIEDADSDSISSEEVEDNYVEIPSNNISMPDSPKGFQNPLITVANKTSVTSKNSSIQEKPSLQGRSLLNSVITVNSVYIPSSYHTSEHLSDQIRESCEFKSQSKKESLSNSNTSEHQQAIEHSEKSSVSKDSEDYNQEYDSIASQLNKMCLIGEGSEARVFLCEFSGADELLAYKQFKMNKVDFNRVQKEFNTVQELDHPNILKYYHLKPKREERDSFGIVMEVMEGGNLYDYVTANWHNIKPDEKINIGKQIIEAVNYLHQQNIIHGDLKPENILLSNDKTRVKLGDFGMCEQIPCDVSFVKKQTGSLRYMAPEMLSNQQFSKKADIWSLGCVLYFLFNGENPYNRVSRISELAEIIKSKTPFEMGKRNNFWNTEIESFIEKCLQLDPKKRPTFTERYNSIS